MCFAGDVNSVCVCPLSGREQAELTGQRLASLGLQYDVLIHSSMTRATETAQIISKHLPGAGPQVPAPP